MTSNNGTRIVELWEMLPEPKRVRFEKDGPVYTLPGDLPAELYLRINQASQESDEAISAEYIAALADDLLRLLQVHQPDLDYLPCSLTQMVALIPRVYTAEPDPPPPPEPQPASSGPRHTTARTPARNPRRSVSSTSSLTSQPNTTGITTTGE